MNDFNDINSMGNGSGELAERNEASSNIFLDMNETDSTGIPSLKQAPVSAISSSASSSKINTQIVIAGLVLAIGAGAIYGMRHIGMQAGLDEQIVSIDYTADANNAEFSKRFTAVMGMLDKSSLAVQLTDDESFADTPFSRVVEEEVEEYEPIDPGMSEEEQMAIRRQREMEQEVPSRYGDLRSASFYAPRCHRGFAPGCSCFGNPGSCWNGSRGVLYRSGNHG